jgi:hypothetical protein
MRVINLIPAEQREGAGGVAGRSGGAALIVLGLIGGLAVLALLYGSARHSVSSRRSELATVNSELSTARSQVDRLTPYTSFISMADQRAQQISQLVASRFDWSHAFNELGRVLPRTAALTTLHGQVGGGAGSSGSSASGGAGAARAASTGAGAGAAASAASSTPPGSTPTFQLTACATSQSEVANTLQRLRLMDGAAEVTLASSAKSGRSGGSGGGAQAASSGPCPAGSPTFSASVTFTPLPTPPAAPSAAAIVPTQVSAPSKRPGPRRVTVSTRPGGSR